MTRRPRAAIDAQDRRTARPGRVERELDEVFARLGERQPKAAVRREHGEVVALGAQGVGQHVHERAALFEKLVYAAAASSTGAARGGGAAALIDGGAEALAQLRDFDVNRLARHDC